MAKFVHLHVHSEYSLLDGHIRIKNLIERVRELGMDSVALTDHGVMYGAIEFYNEALDTGKDGDKKPIKPIVGCETYIAPRSRFDKKLVDGVSSYHLVLLAKNKKGYQNLCKLVSEASLNGFYYNPRIDKEILREHAEGLIGLSACLKGEVQYYLLRDDYERAKEVALEYKSIFEDGDFYLEVMDHNIPEEKKIHPLLLKLSKETGIKLVATNDCHYLRKEDYQAHDVLLCIQTGKTIDDPNRMRYPEGQFYLRSADEMEELFSWCPEAVENTVEVAQKCNLELDLNKNILPDFPVPEGYTKESYLEHLCYEGLKRRYGTITSQIEDRLRTELKVINDKGFAGYFLIVWDFINYAKKQGIPVGPGRGSAAGSLVAYAIGITDVDPLKYNLLFERFLNPERKSMPDIDTDFCQIRREEVIEYVTRKYGSDKVSQIVTFGRMKARAAIRDVGRVYNVPLAFVDKLAKMVPAEPGMTLEKALKTPEFKQMYESDPTAKKIIDMAMQVEGLARNASIHAAGVVISKVPITDVAPLYKMKGDEVVVQYDMNNAAKVGLLKMDFLGLRNLTILDDAVKLIEKRHGVKLDLLKLPLDDPKTYELLQRGETTGVFQLESQGMRRYLIQLKPEKLEDIIAMCALYRPGPLKGGMVDDFIRRKHGIEKTTYLHPVLEPILKETYGVIVYQEQVMQIANVVAGYSMGEADQLRRAMGKKKMDVMRQQKETFLKGAAERNFDRALAEKIFSLMEKFASYGFNKSHTACYALIAYQTAYLKAHYPKEFMAALLTSVAGNTDKTSFFIKECRRMGIKILPPDINESDENFTVTDRGIRFGLAAIKNVGVGPISSILKSRKDGPFKDIFDFCCRVEGINRRVLESLILSGAMDSLGETRTTLLENLDKCIDYGACKRKEKNSAQMSLFSLEEEVFSAPKLVRKPEMEKRELLAKEKELLGLYVSDHPLTPHREVLEDPSLCPVEDLANLEENQTVYVGGIISKVQKKITKKNEIMAVVELEDLTGSVSVTIFPNTLNQFSHIIQADSLVIVVGKLEKEKPFISDEEEDAEEEAIPKIIATSVMPLSKANLPKKRKYKRVEDKKSGEKKMRGVHIRLENNGTNLEKLRQIIVNAPGEEPLYLHVQTGPHVSVLKASSRYFVHSLDKIKEDVESLLGGGTIWAV